MKQSSPHLKRMIIEEIEPRILYSADLNPYVLEQDSLDGAGEVLLLESSSEPLQSVSGSATNAEVMAASHEIVFIDEGVENYEQLVTDVQAQASDGRRIEVVVLKAGESGIDQISRTLAQYQDLSAVHIISHGQAGALQLGGVALDYEALLAHATQIEQWSDAFDERGDVLVYGCDLASSGQGRSLVEALSRLTGADVAASDDGSGASSWGGDWELEYAAGGIEASVAAGFETRAHWQGLLGATYHLQGDTSPPFSGLATTAPTAPTLVNFDPGRDSAAGLLLTKNAALPSQSDATKHQTWVAPAGALAISNESVSLTFWSDMKDGMNGAQTADVALGKAGTVTAYLMDLASPSATTGTVIASGSVTDSTWGDGFAWEQKTVSFGNVTYSVAAGRYLAVKIVVNDSSGDDLWFAYDTTSFQSRLVIGSNAAPAITSNGGEVSASLNVAEDSTTVTTVMATDADLPAQTLAYSISGGADAARFAINGGNGALSFAAAPNREAATDVDGNNVYEVTVQVSDGLGGTDTQQLSVTVTDLDEFDVSAVSDTNAAANTVTESAAAGTTVGVTALASDADATNNSITYSLDDDAGGRFAIHATTGVVTVNGVLDYETAARSSASCYPGPPCNKPWTSRNACARPLNPRWAPRYVPSKA